MNRCIDDMTEAEFLKAERHFDAEAEDAEDPNENEEAA